MPESLKVSFSLSGSVPPAISSGLGESLEARSEPHRGTMTEPHVISNECPSSDESSSSRLFSSTNCLSMDFHGISQNSAGCEENRMSDLCSTISSCGPNNRLEGYPLLLRVPFPSDSSNPSNLPPGSGMPSLSQSATCLPFSTMATPHGLSSMYPPTDMRHGDCREGILNTRVLPTASQDADCEASTASQQYSSCDAQSLPHDFTAIHNNRASSPERSPSDSGPPYFHNSSGFTGLASRPRLSSDTLHALSSSRPIPLSVTIPQDPRISSSPPFNVRVSVCPPSTYSHSRGSSIRSRRVSTDSTPLSPLDVAVRYHFSSDEGDSLPALLSPSGTSSQSERDRPSTPATFSDAGSQVTSSEDGRSRYIRPGTPIQTQLPEIEFYEATSYALSSSSDGGETSSSILWFVSEAAQEEDEVEGDIWRAKELLDGLERIEYALVRRYEKIRGNGYDICAICRDLLLPAPPTPRQATNFEPDSSWNVLASSVLPFNPMDEDEECSIHAFPCAHLFHTDCLVPWLCIKTTCPTCRRDIDPHSLTLRIRGWSLSRFPHLDQIASEPRYVNVDVLGRRIPWHRPPAPSLEEWVQQRETTHRQEGIRRQRLGGPAGSRHGSRLSKVSRKSLLSTSEELAAEGRVEGETIAVRRPQVIGISDSEAHSTLRMPITEDANRTEELDDGIPVREVATPRVSMGVGRQTPSNMTWSGVVSSFDDSPSAMPQTRSQEHLSARVGDDDESKDA